MNEHEKIQELIPFYLNESLDPQQTVRIEAHLASCQACRDDLAFWQSASAAVREANQQVQVPLPQQPLRGAMAAIQAGNSRSGIFRSFFSLLKAQVMLVRREIWTASLLVFLIGFVAAVVLEFSGFFGAIAPLVAAAGVSLLYGKENDPAYELTLSTPVSQAQILLSRLVLVFGYDLLLMLAGFAGILLLTPEQVALALLLDWLAPMTFLSSLALLLSLVFGSANAITVAYAAWLLRYVIQLPDLQLPVISRVGSYEHLWNTPALLFILSGICLLLALLTVQKRQPPLRT